MTDARSAAGADLIEGKGQPRALPRVSDTLDRWLRAPDPVRMALPDLIGLLKTASLEAAAVTVVISLCNRLQRVPAVGHDPQVAAGREPAHGQGLMIELPVTKIGIEVVHRLQLTGADTSALQIATTPFLDVGTHGEA